MSSFSKARQRITALLDENSFVEIGAKVTGGLFPVTPGAFRRAARIRREQKIFLLFQTLTNIHTGNSFPPEG